MSKLGKVLMIIVAIVMAILIYTTQINAGSRNIGEQIFNNNCVECHGRNGEGSLMAPPFVNNQFIAEASDEEIAEVIFKGRSLSEETKVRIDYVLDMPRYNLDPDLLEELINHIRGFNRKDGTTK